MNIKKPNLSNIKELLNKDLSSIMKKNKKKKSFSNFKGNKKTLVIDIGTNETKVIVGKQEKKNLVIYDAFTFKTPGGALGDGSIMNALDVANALQNAMISRGIQIKDVIFTSNSTTIINRELLVPVAEDDELETLVKYEIQQYLPINMNDYIVQYSILETVNKEEVNKYRVLAVTYPHRIARQYFNLVNDCKLKAVALDISFNSVKKLLNHSTSINENEHKGEETIAFIDLGAESLNVDIYTNGELDFTRIIRSGGNAIDKHLSDKFQISLEEAEKRKIEFCDFTLINGGEEQREITEGVKDVVDEWTEELNRIFQFYRNKRIGNRIHKVYFHGGTSKIKGLPEYMNNSLNLDLERVEDFDNISFGKNFNKEDLHKYLNALGALIRL